jgi:hypothetical protein
MSDSLEERKKDAKILWEENVKSLLYRYDDPADMIESVAKFTAKTFEDVVTEPVAIIRLAHSYSYQSCEHPEWDGSGAKAMVDALIVSVSHRIPGYDAAPWSI